MNDKEIAEHIAKSGAAIKYGVALAMDEYRRRDRSTLNWEDGKMVVRTGEDFPVRVPDEAHRYSR